MYINQRHECSKEVNITKQKRVVHSSYAYQCTCTSDAVHVVLRREREGIVDDILDLWDVETTRSYIRRDQQRNLQQRNHRKPSSMH